MDKLLFFLWMLLFPLMDDIGAYIRFKARGNKAEKEDDSPLTAAILLIFIIAIYLGVGALLYQKPHF